MLVNDRLYDAICGTSKESIKDDIKKYKTGIIVNVEPIQVNYEGVILTKSFLKINSGLLNQTINFKNLTGSTLSGTINIENGSFFMPSRLYKGCEVTLIEMDNGLYYLSNIVE